MIPFILPRDRDAWPTIRGFVYQVDLTIERWIGLRDDEVLELERGEDIDTLQRAVEAGPEERSRLLEQVKHRDEGLTLRSGPARAFLANALDHQRANPSLRLRFRYTTNAEPGVERSTTMPGGVAGVVAWEQLRRGEWPAESVPDALAAIRELLTGAAPDDVGSDLWSRFQDFVGGCSDDDLLAFVRACEWATRHVPAADAGAAVQARLLEAGYASSEPGAEDLYHRLFAYVFRRLSQADVKRLTPGDLSAQAAAAREGAPVEDRALLSTIRKLLVSLEGRVSALEERLAAVQERSAAALERSTAAHARFDELARKQGITAAVEYTASVPVLDPPPLVDRGSSRRETVSRVLDRGAGAVWLAIHGPSGTGKSQLALLLARELGSGGVWIRFRDLRLPEAVVRFDAAVRALLGPESGAAPPSLRERVERALGATGAASVVVLDDLPEFRAGDDLAVRIAALVSAARAVGSVVLSTSILAVPREVQDELKAGVLIALRAPPFTTGEAREVLAAFGAPADGLDEAFVELVNAVAGGHPVLLRASARYLASVGWRVTGDSFMGLVKKDFAGEVNEDTVRAVLRTVEDDAARELLYRLNVPFGDFTLDDVRALASVRPNVPAPRERLQRLLGLWVQREAGDRYAVSPLIRTLGTADLPPEVTKACHAQVAKRIVSRAEIGAFELNEALIHFLTAEEFNSAGLLLLRGLTAFREAKVPGPSQPFPLLWTEFILPEGINFSIRLSIMGLQLAIRRKHGADTSRLEQELDRMIAVAGEDNAWGVFTAGLMATHTLYPFDIRAAGRYLATAVRAWPGAEAQFRSRGIPIPEHVPLDAYVWMAAGEVRTTEDVAAWFELIEGLPPEWRAALFADPFAARSSVHVVTTLLLDEGAGQPADQRWPKVFELLDELERRAERIGLEPLWAAVVSTRVSVYGEFLGDLSTAERLVREGLGRDPRPDTVFLLSNTLALILLDDNRTGEAMEWLERARRTHSATFDRESVACRIRLSNLVGRSDAASAVEIAREAADWADAHAEHRELVVVEAYGELAVASWLAGDRRGAFLAWEQAADELFRARNDSDAWKSLFVLFGHVSGYMAIFAESGEALSPASGEPYAPPRRGIFLLRPPGREAAYQEHFFYLVHVQLAIVAEAVGETARGAAWAVRAVEIARAHGYHQVAVVALPVLMAEALERDDYNRVLSLALEEGAFWAAEHLHPSEPDEPGPAPETVLGPRSTDSWRVVEGFAAIRGLLLIFLRIAEVAVYDAASAQRLAARAVVACRAEAASSPEPAAWHVAVDLLDRIFFGADTDEQLIALGGEISLPDPDFTRALRTMARLGGSLRPRSNPHQNAYSHLDVAEFIDQNFRHNNRFRTVVDRFFIEFWRRRFDLHRFRFSNPSAVKGELDAATTAGADALRRVLRAVATGLGVEPHPAVLGWLNTAAGSGKQTGLGAED